MSMKMANEIAELFRRVKELERQAALFMAIVDAEMQRPMKPVGLEKNGRSPESEKAVSKYKGFKGFEVHAGTERLHEGWLSKDDALALVNRHNSQVEGNDASSS